MRAIAFLLPSLDSIKTDYKIKQRSVYTFEFVVNQLSHKLLYQGRCLFHSVQYNFLSYGLIQRQRVFSLALCRLLAHRKGVDVYEQICQRRMKSLHILLFLYLSISTERCKHFSKLFIDRK